MKQVKLAHRSACEKDFGCGAAHVCQERIDTTRVSCHQGDKEQISTRLIRKTEPVEQSLISASDCAATGIVECEVESKSIDSPTNKLRAMQA